jgi:dTDP-D-glucose 4,6-dehydratase
MLIVRIFVATSAIWKASLKLFAPSPPDIIVNAAAHTAVDKAESEPELARTINAIAPGILAQEAKRIGAWLIHYSTDYVFDGSGDKFWQETDPTAPSVSMAKPSGKAKKPSAPRAVGISSFAPVGFMRRAAVTLPKPC